ncbi:MAG: alpha/beta hydrolase [Kiritimatiellae bacterium]|nr:alpha/beta hydrolase [Kiritimatiellia bacterium]
MKTLLGLLSVPLFCSLFAGERVSLWPEGKMPDAQPRQIAAMVGETSPGKAPYLEWLPPPAASNANGICMILISGGGYRNLCDGWLVDLWNEKFTAYGCRCVKLVHRTPRPEGLPFYQSAWEDAQRAVRLVRRDAAKRGFKANRVGVIGMSAGAHLSTLLATSALTPAYAPVDELDEDPCHVDFAITGAIAYGHAEGNAPSFTAPEFKFDAKTAPMCMFHGGVDVCTPLASTHVYRELRRRGVPAELHLFADRPHNFWGLAAKPGALAGYDNWFADATGFIRQLNLDGRLGAEVESKDHWVADLPVAFEKQALWPEGLMPDASTNQCTPFLEWHVPKTLTTRAIQIVYSGGGYWDNHPEEWDGVPAARKFLNAKGMAVVVLKYRTPYLKGAPKHRAAWQDLQRAVRMVRAQANARGLDPNRIGVWGSSAGGHLSLMGATSASVASYAPVDAADALPCNVQWAVAVYPAYALTDGAENVNKTGGNDNSAVPVPEFAFDALTCPTLFLHGDADAWAAMNSVKCWEKMRAMGVQGDVHTLVKRGHCFMMKAAPGTGSYDWLDRAWEFMNHKGFNR